MSWDTRKRKGAAGWMRRYCGATLVVLLCNLSGAQAVLHLNKEAPAGRDDKACCSSRQPLLSFWTHVKPLTGWSLRSLSTFATLIGLHAVAKPATMLQLRMGVAYP